jgi:acetaldehyde/propanal dehydrogenase
MTEKACAAIIGPGNIGTDLLMKCLRSDWIEPVWMVGIEDSQGIQRARDLGLKTSTDGIDGLMAGWNDRPVEFVFDATSAAAHADNSQKVVERGALMIDLTPAAIGPYCIPPVNLDAVLSDEGTRNVNMVTCGGQATIPMVRAVSRVQAVRYAEIVATVASKSVGMGTRDNIDEFTRTTSAAIASIGEADEGKAIIVINPAEPPLIMRDTIHCLTHETPAQSVILDSIDTMVAEMQEYVPGYQLVNAPVFDDHRVTISVQIEGLGDFLPTYAGNLDIMTAAGLRTAEMIAQRRQHYGSGDGS